LLCALTVAAALPAPVSEVTVFDDRARIVREARVELTGRGPFVLPVLPASVRPDSVRVEARGAEVRRVDVRSVSWTPLPVESARKLLAALDSLDDSLAANSAAQATH